MGVPDLEIVFLWHICTQKEKPRGIIILYINPRLKTTNPHMTNRFMPCGSEVTLKFMALF